MFPPPAQSPKPPRPGRGLLLDHVLSSARRYSLASRVMKRALMILLGVVFAVVTPATAGEPVLVMFGDSTTAPRPGQVGKVYPARIQEAFEAAGTKVRVINRGVGGDHTARARKRFAEAVLAENPALVVIQFGINDAAVDVWKDPPATAPRVSREDYVANLRWMAEEARRAGVAVVFMTPNPLRWTEKMVQLYGKPPYDPTDPEGFEKPHLLGHIEAMRDLAEELSLPLVDIHAAYGEKADALLLDGVHPNDAGHALVAERLLPVIRKILATGGGIKAP